MLEENKTGVPKEKMKDHIKELRAQIDAMSLAPSASSALLKVTLEILHRMKQEKVMQAVPLAHRTAAAAFLACDSQACIAIPKLKRAFGKNIIGKNISKARRALQISHGTAHEKLDSLCKVCKISNTVTILRAHHYVELLREDGAMPSNIAAASLYIAEYRRSKGALTAREMRDLTGCTDITLRKLVHVIILKESQKKK